ncbi:hypothetical protein FBEOM_7108 [Fusarium beomiforme]|uniref:Uncharacterized protein n=1 Tax=Fusarium beomiforme TaxID=44412 RepID=A0A9P5AJD0_9HYPO|nr:hypothetical protein FBEOM_7108 [Fusarium beomiforme]
MRQPSQKSVNATQSGTSRRLPSWYCHLVALTIKKDRDLYPTDFDGDLPDLGEGSTITDGAAFEHAGCECNSDCSDRDCESEWDSTEDRLSKRSYDVSDADYYYELEFAREERKREVRDNREHDRKVRAERRNLKSSKEDEVQKATNMCKNLFDEAIPCLSLISLLAIIQVILGRSC